MTIRRKELFIWILVLQVLTCIGESTKADFIKAGKSYSRAVPESSTLFTNLLHSLLETRVLQGLNQLGSERENIGLVDVKDWKSQDVKKEIRANLQLLEWLNKKVNQRRGWGNGQLPWKY